MTNEQTKHIILGFVTLLIGIVLIGVVATQTLDVTDRDAIVNESISIQSAANPATSDLTAYTNENATALNVTDINTQNLVGYDSAITSGYVAVTCSVANFTNSTGVGGIIGAGNYTLSNNDCTIIATATSVHNNSMWNSTYNTSYTIPSTGINESVTYTLGTLGDTAATDCEVSSFVLSNSTDSALTATTDYVLTATDGTFTIVNSSTTYGILTNSAANTTLADYSYCPEGYMNLQWGRTVTNLVPGFFGLALLGVSLLIFFRIFKDAGVM